MANILGQTQEGLSGAYGDLGAELGEAFDWYQSNGPNNPIANTNNQGSYLCYFDRSPLFTAKEAAEYGKPEWYVAYDRSGPGVGDYLVSEDTTDTYFIIDQAPLTPSKCVKTNATVNIFRPGTSAPLTPAQKANFVKTNTGGDGLMIASNWPISLLSGSRGEKDETGNPFSGREPWFTFLMPLIPTVRPRTDDIFVDTEGFRYQISACEKTELGYRGTARWKEA